MSYEPSHRKAPRQERWPNATPGEGWPAYQQAGDDRAWEPAAAYAGSRNGYGTTDNGYGVADNGYGVADNGYGTTDQGYGSTWGRAPVDRGYGHGDAWGGTRSDEGQGYWAGGTGYAGNGYAGDGYAGDGYAGDGYAGNGYADGFDGAADGYADGYVNDYGGTEEHYGTGEYYEAPNGWDGYTQPGHEFTVPAGYVAQEEYPALDPGTSSVLVAPDTMGEWWRADQRHDGMPGHRGAVVGVTMGVLAAAVAIGVATLVAAFVRPQSSPVSAVGGVFIDRIPASLRGHLMAHFGAHGQTVLLVGVVGLLAIVLGFMARRNVSIGVAGIAAFGILGAFIAITRPESRASDVIPSALGGLAGIVALLWLARASAPTAGGQLAYSGGRRAR
jgi:hypothetical protein